MNMINMLLLVFDIAYIPSAQSARACARLSLTNTQLQLQFYQHQRQHQQPDTLQSAYGLFEFLFWHLKKLTTTTKQVHKT